MKIFFVVLLCCVSVAAQTRDDLAKKYGKPKFVTENYEARPNILLTVTYGAEGQLCGMLFKPKFTEENLPEVTSEMLKTVADEVVPADRRGKNIINGFLSGSEIFGTTWDYEKLKIWDAFKENGERWVLILWKDKSCNNFPREKPLPLKSSSPKQ